MFLRGRPLAITKWLVDTSTKTREFLFRTRRRRWTLIAVSFMCLLMITFNMDTPITCTYIDPCVNDSIINFAGNVTSKTCPLCEHRSDWRVDVDAVTSLTKLEEQMNWLEAGGRYTPRHCSARQRVAIIIPFRNRPHHLKIFLKNIHPFLRKQSVQYGIYVVEQSEGSKFNRGQLLNIGFQTALTQDHYDCFIFHDVDYIPLDLRNTYGCSSRPKHMSAIVDTFENKLPYPGFFGGVAALTADQFKQINGFSNRYWGWGGEDDDIVERFKQEQFTIFRHDSLFARYSMLRHSRDRGNPVNPKRYNLLYEARKVYKKDGLNSVKYEALAVKQLKLFTVIQVDLVEQ